MKKTVVILLFLILSLAPTFAFEDFIITTDGKLTNIIVQDKNIVEVSPLITIMNERNTLLVQPKQIGETNFTVTKNNIEKVCFNIKISNEETKIGEVDGFEIFRLDNPPEMFELDSPPERIKPQLRESEGGNNG